MIADGGLGEAWGAISLQIMVDRSRLEPLTSSVQAHQLVC
jgi:hypothetical protein